MSVPEVMGQQNEARQPRLFYGRWHAVRARASELARQIEITLPKRNLSATAQLLEDQAPKTCDAVWKLLEKPVESTAIHAIRAGREIYCEIPHLPERIPPENLTIYPLAGEILYFHFPPYMLPSELGKPQGFTEFAIYYGRDSVADCIGVGPTPSNCFATIVSNLKQLAEACERIHLEGAERIVVRRK
jgi:hypothetical protein